jgi:hypothetical protein
MSAFEGPNVVTNGLVLALDGANIRSFRGEPTTNLISSADTMSSWTSYYRTVSSSTFTTEFGTTGYRFVNQPSWNGIYRNFNLGSSGTYTFSAWFRYNGGSSSNNGATVYVGNYGGGDTATALNKSIVGTWQRISRTVNVTSPSNVRFYLISYGGLDNGTGVPDFSSWEVTMPQIEAGSRLTPFVNGTRGTTVATGGGWADLTSNTNHGELVNGPTFNSANFGSIVFDAVDDVIRIPNSTTLDTQTPTVEVWIKTNATSQNGFWFEKGTVNTQYSLFQEGSVIQWRQRLTNGTLTNLSTTTANFINTSNWYQLVGTFVSGNRRLYINGTLVNSDTLSGTIATNTGGMSIGAYGGFSGSRSYYYNGNLAICKIYNRALSAAEVAQNFNATRNRFGI